MNNVTTTSAGSVGSYKSPSIYSVLDVFDSIFNDMGSSSINTTGFSSLLPSFPPYDVIIDEETKDLTFRFAVAGYPKEAISISFEDSSLILNLDKIETSQDGKSIIQKSIKSSSSRTKYPIPYSKYDIDNSEAKYENGILEVFIPAKAEMRPRTLQIK